MSFSDRRALVFIPKGFDARRPGLIVVFLHGHRATIERDVRDRQKVADQIAQANANAVLIAPQFAVNASDSSAGRFWESYGFARFLGEAGEHLTRLHGDRRTRKTFATLPVVVVAYSGGYVPAAWALHKGGTDKRVLGVLMLDALYGEVHKYADWIARHPNAFFISAYTSSSAKGNEALQSLLADRDIATTLPPRLGDRVPAHVGANHTDYVTRLGGRPIRDMLGACPATPAPLRQAHRSPPATRCAEPHWLVDRQRLGRAPVCLRSAAADGDSRGTLSYRMFSSDSMEPAMPAHEEENLRYEDRARFCARTE